MGAIKFRANSYNPEELNGKVAVVTGAAAGIGKATLMVLAQSGAAVIGLDQDTNGLTQVLGWSKSKSLKVETFQCDVSNQQKLRDAFKFADSTFGACDILVAAAGIGLYKDFLGISEEEIDRVLDVNIKGVLFSMQEAFQRMREKESGSIIAISSVQSNLSLEGCVVYAATKAAVTTAARTLALEAGRHGVRVNTISPGTINTPMLDRDLSGMNLKAREEFVERVNQANLIGRIGDASEVADAALFLASSRSSYITASDLKVDGGFTALKNF